MKKYFLFREDLESEVDKTIDSQVAVNIKDREEYKAINTYISEYNSKKNRILDIYRKSETQDDITKSLKNMGVMDKDGKVENPLLSIHISYSNKARQIERIEEEINNTTKSISDLKSSSDGSPSILNTIKAKEESKRELLKSINELDKEIKEIESKAKEKLSELKDKLKGK